MIAVGISLSVRDEIEAILPFGALDPTVSVAGWRAEIDGQPVELRRVNVVQQGVVVPAGKHVVRLTFWPRSLGVGLIISAVVLLICGGILVLRK